MRLTFSSARFMGEACLYGGVGGCVQQERDSNPRAARHRSAPSITDADRAGGGESAFARGLIARASEPTGGGSREVGESSKRLPR